jgi:hypothetical protein
MNKMILFLLACYHLSVVNANAVLPRLATLNFNLVSIENGATCPDLLNNAPVTIKYEYNFDSNMGLAYIKQLQETRWTEALYPLGLSDTYSFMSHMAPKTIRLNGGEVVVYRVIFNLRFNGDSQAMLMIGLDGDCIMATDVINVTKL